MNKQLVRHYTAIGVVFAFATFLITPVTAPYLESKGFSQAQLSLIFMMFPLAPILFLPYFGRLADRVSRRTVIWFGIWVEIGALAFYVFGSHGLVFALARFLEAFAVLVTPIIILAQVEDGVDGGKRGAQTGWLLSFERAGELGGPLFGGLLSYYFFPEFPFVVSAIILFILSFFLLRTPGKKTIVVPRPKGAFRFVWLSEIKSFLKHRELRGIAMLGFAANVGFGPFLPLFLPLFIVGNLGLSYREVGLALFVWGVPHLLQGVIGSLADRIGSWRCIIAGNGLMAIIFILFPLVSNRFSILLVAVLCMGLASSLWNVSGWSMLSEIGVRDQCVGRIVTSYSALVEVGSLISFVVSAWLLTRLEITTLVVLYGLVIIAGIGVALPFLRKRRGQCIL